MKLQKTGYSRHNIIANLALGVFDGIDSALWCYAFAAIIFSHLLGPFLPLGLVIILGGWAALSISVALTSNDPVHMVNIDEQAVVIIGAIAATMMEQMGPEASPARSLATILAVMSIASLSLSLCFYLSSRFQFARLLELLPYPVVCGFMAGIAWLLLDAGITLAIGTSISPELPGILAEGDRLPQLLACLAGGLFLCVFTARVERAWALPAASTAIVVVFYAWVMQGGAELDQLRDDGWMFQLQPLLADSGSPVASLSFADIDFLFIFSVLPQLVTAVFLAMLSASMNLSAMSTINTNARIDGSTEMQGLSAGNLACGVIACPPGFSDAAASILYRGFGATTRWMPLASSLVCLVVAFGGGWLVSYTPRVLIAATILLFAFQLFYDWMYVYVRRFNLLDYAVVCAILVTVVMLGFMQGILIGVLLTVLIFVLRYSLISSIQNRYTLNDHRSPVERSAESNLLLNQHGGEAIVFTLRGYLFFGTANNVRDSIRNQLESGRHRVLLIDLHRVTGIDISALNSLIQVRQLCELRDIHLYFVCHDAVIANRLVDQGVVERANLYEDTDIALEKLEEFILASEAPQAKSLTIENYLEYLVPSPEPRRILIASMERKTLQGGDFLFRRGAEDDGLYIVESGSVSALLEIPGHPDRHLKKFMPGAVVGELSAYTDDRKRTASVIANSETVVYHLDPQKLSDKTLLHELVARTISTRIEYMNRRLGREMI